MPPYTQKEAANGNSGMACCVLHTGIRQALIAAEQQGIVFANLDQDKDGVIDMITILHRYPFPVLLVPVLHVN